VVGAFSFESFSALNMEACMKFAILLIILLAGCKSRPDDSIVKTAQNQISWISPDLVYGFRGDKIMDVFIPNLQRPGYKAAVTSGIEKFKSSCSAVQVNVLAQHPGSGVFNNLDRPVINFKDHFDHNRGWNGAPIVAYANSAGPFLSWDENGTFSTDVVQQTTVDFLSFLARKECE
jgi:hypothetical protein